MSTATDYTLSEMILIAAHKLQEQGQSPFSAEELIVASWREFPRAFGLKGYADQFPDSNRVLSSIMGERGLTRKGWLVKMGQKLYALSPEGKRVVRRISEGDIDDEEPPPPPRLARDREKLLLSLLDAVATKKVKSGKYYDLTFDDACRFWGVSNLAGSALDAQLRKVEETVAQAEELIANGPFKAMGRQVTRNDLDLLRQVQYQLQERFARHLTLLRSRN